MKCPECGSRMDHKLAAVGEAEFRFRCPSCGAAKTSRKFPKGVYLGQPWTPLGFGG